MSTLTYNQKQNPKATHSKTSLIAGAGVAAASSLSADGAEATTISREDYDAQLPITEEFFLFNRSWYNRAGVEHVMGFCSNDEYEEFMQSMPKFEEMLVRSGIKLLKYYLDVSKGEQKRRLADRRRDPLKQWKTSPIDAVALKHWKAHSKTRDVMLMRTHTAIAPWHIVHADNKRLARINLVRDILSRLYYEGKKTKLVQPDPTIVFEFTPDCIAAKRLAR